LMSHGAAMSARLWSARASFRRSWSFIAMRARNRSRRSFVRLIPTASSQPSLHRRGEERTRRTKEDGRRMRRDEGGQGGRNTGTKEGREMGRRKRRTSINRCPILIHERVPRLQQVVLQRVQTP
jgi:hypothetical protein